ncbi:ATP-binding protein [Roseomonas sp. CCTCC AB2023176]|uniref:hybrid sensor histidine kinase/response regulator n=1 Tax=Roseomonas sp. CCTCC AB2023176 TaxID=3342640 RepID=UPI0035DD3C34
MLLLPPDGGLPLAAAVAGSRRRPPPIAPGALLPSAGLGWAGGVTIAGPVPNPLTGEWALFFARPIEVAGYGRAIAVAEVPVPLIAGGLTLLTVAPGAASQRVLLIRSQERILLASAPHDEGRIGRPLPRSMAEGREGARISSVQTTIYPEISLIVSDERDAAMAAWNVTAKRIVGIAAGFALLILIPAVLLVFLLRQRDRAERDRARDRRLLDLAIASMSEGFVMWDAEDRLVVCNERYRDFYRQSAPILVPGARLVDVMRFGVEHGQYPQAGDNPEAFIAEAIAHHRAPWDTPPQERLLPDGRWILVTERAVPGGGRVGIRTDITAIKRAAADLAAARDAAAGQAAAKSRFLARMSHELRTPLNGVLGMAQALVTDPDLTPAQRAHAEVLMEAGRHLLSVADDILDLAQVESGKVALRPSPVGIQALLEACTGIARAAGQEKGVSVRLDHDASLPASVEADALRLRQLLINLLSNAVKFTPAGGRVLLRSRACGLPSGPGLRIEVLDTGPGIPPEQRAAVFRDFVRLTSVEPPSRGTGLGLAIAANIVDAMGGRIGVDDSPEAAAEGRTGARFWAELPLIAAAEPAPAAARPEGPMPFRALRILVVDDVATNRLVAKALLGRLGHEAVLAPGGAEGIEQVRRAWAEGAPFDAVLMDLAMPGMDGLQATTRIRELSPRRGGAVPVFALTAGVVDRDAAACRQAGMNGFITKPVTLEMLTAALSGIQASADVSG